MIQPLDRLVEVECRIFQETLSPAELGNLKPLH
jgi:hypothetical protein